MFELEELISFGPSIFIGIDRSGRGLSGRDMCHADKWTELPEHIRIPKLSTVGDIVPDEPVPRTLSTIPRSRIVRGNDLCVVVRRQAIKGGNTAKDELSFSASCLAIRARAIGRLSEALSDRIHHLHVIPTEFPTLAYSLRTYRSLYRLPTIRSTA